MQVIPRPGDGFAVSRSSYWPMNLFRTFLLLLLAASAAAAPPTWNELPSHSRELYRQVVTPIRNQGLEPKEDYTFFRMLALESQPDDLPTTMTAAQDRFLQLEVAGALLRTQLQASIEQPTTATLAAYSAKSPQRFDPRESVELDSIYIRKNGPAGSEAAHSLAAEARRALDAGVPFDEVATRFSEARSRSTGGHSGTIYRGGIAPETEAVVFKLKKGEVVGPFERDHGFYFFHAAERRAGFSVANPSDLARARDAWLKETAGVAAQKILDAYTAKAPTINAEAKVANWPLAPWIETADHALAPFGIAYFNSARSDLGLQPPAKWSATWSEEATFYRDAAIFNLAAEDHLGPNDKDAATSLEMLRTVMKGENRMRALYAAMQPDNATVEKYFTTHRDELFPPIPQYSFLIWQMPLPKTDDAGSSTTQEVAKLADRLLTDLYAATKDAAPKSVAEVRELFDGLTSSFPGSHAERHQKLDSLSPFADSILYRTEPGHLSRPFDEPSSVGIVYMIARDYDVATLDRVRDQVVDAWRREQLAEFVKQLKAKVAAAGS